MYRIATEAQINKDFFASLFHAFRAFAANKC
jgi:hypothetical protein